MADATDGPLSPPSSSSSSSLLVPRATERSLTLVHPSDLTPVAAAELKDHEAERLLALGDLDGALGALHKAVYLRPDHAPLHATLAHVYSLLGDLKAALASFRRLVAIDANPPQRVKDEFAALLDLHAYTLLTQGEAPAVAIAYLTEALALNALDETLWLHRALAHIHAHSLDKALHDVDHCVNLNGKDVEYFVLRAKLHWRLHMHEKATHDIQRAARLRPDHPEVLEHERRLRDESETIYAQAARHALLREWSDTITSLTRAAELAPHETKLYVLRATAHRARGELEQAMADMDRALQCHNARRAMTTTTAMTSTDAVDGTREYRALMTQRHAILNDVAQRCLRDQSFQVALNAMNQVLEGEHALAQHGRSDTTVPSQYYVHRGDAYRGLGNLQAALADYHRALEVGPPSHDVCARVALLHYQFGIALFNDAQFAAAEVEFARAIADDGRVARYHVRKGDAARFQEKHHVACDDYLTALRLDPRDNDTRNKLLQYAIDPTTVTTTVPREQDVPSTVPRQLAPAPSAVRAALDAYKQKNRTVQELFQQRPALPPAKRTGT